VIKASWKYFKSWLFHLWASLISVHPGTVNWLVRAGKPAFATRLVEGRFDRLAPKDERVATNDWFKKKWGFPEAAQFLLRCRTAAAAAVLNQYFTHDELPRFRATVLTELLLTLPPISNDPDKKAKADEIVNLVARTNGELIGELLAKGQAQPAYELVSRIKEKEVPKAMRFAPVETGAYLLRKLRRDDPDWYAVFEGKLDAKYAEDVIHHWRQQEFWRKKSQARADGRPPLEDRTEAPPRVEFEEERDEEEEPDE
jgi:hypothetical protein